MKEVEAILFDIDGTLYSFDEGDESQFTSSRFGKQIGANCIRFFEERFKLTSSDVEKMYLYLSRRYNGEVSLAVENELGIDRGEYFVFSWDLVAEELYEKR